MTNHLTNLISKAAHDLDHCITLDLGNALANDDHIGDWAAMPLQVDDLAEYMILNYAGYVSFEELEDETRQAELEAADFNLYWNARL